MRGLWRNAWTRQMEQNELFLEPAIKKAVCVCFVLSFRMPRCGLGTAYQEERIQEAFLLLSSAHHRSSHHPSQKVDHLRTALRESDIPILIVVHDWALLLDAFQEKVTISY